VPRVAPESLFPSRLALLPILGFVLGNEYMSKLMMLKEWVDLDEAVTQLRMLLKEDVSKSDIFQLALDNKFTLSLLVSSPLHAVRLEEVPISGVSFTGRKLGKLGAIPFKHKNFPEEVNQALRNLYEEDGIFVNPSLPLEGLTDNDDYAIVFDYLKSLELECKCVFYGDAYYIKAQNLFLIERGDDYGQVIVEGLLDISPSQYGKYLLQHCLFESRGISLDTKPPAIPYSFVVTGNDTWFNIVERGVPVGDGSELSLMEISRRYDSFKTQPVTDPVPKGTCLVVRTAELFRFIEENYSQGSSPKTEVLPVEQFSQLGTTAERNLYKTISVLTKALCEYGPKNLCDDKGEPNCSAVARLLRGKVPEGVSGLSEDSIHRRLRAAIKEL